MNVIASRRAEAYAKYLKSFGLSPTIVTHLWQPLDKSGKHWHWHTTETAVEHDENNEYKVTYIPRVKTSTQKVIDILLEIPGLKTLTRFLSIMSGHPEPELVYSYQNFKRYLWKHLNHNNYDCVLAIFSPDYHIRLGYEINKKFKLPFVADYRDLWDNRLVNKEATFGLKENFIHYYLRKYHTKWLKKVLYSTIVSEPWSMRLKELTGVKESHVITNGFEQDSFQTNLTKVSTETFFITYTGRVYPENNFSIFYKALNTFLDTVPEDERIKIKIRFFTQPLLQDLSRQKANIPLENLMILGWIRKEDVINKLKESAVLFLPGFPNQPGRYPGKIFEYLGSERNILVAPSDHSVLESLLQETNAGLCSSDVDIVARFLQQKFRDWKNTGEPAYSGNKELINQYSREYQIGKMANLMKGRIPPNLNK